MCGDHSILLFLLSHNEEMGADAEKRRFGLEEPSDFEEIGSLAWIAHTLTDIRQQPSGSLDSVDSWIREPCGCDLGDNIARSVKIGCREVVEPFGRIVVLPLLEVSLDDGDKTGILKQIAGETIER